MFLQQEKKKKENKNLFWTFWGYVEKKASFLYAGFTVYAFDTDIGKFFGEDFMM